LNLTNLELISRDGSSTGSLLIKMAAAAILNFEKRLPLLHHSTDLHQTYLKHWDFDLKHIHYTENA